MRRFALAAVWSLLLCTLAGAGQLTYEPGTSGLTVAPVSLFAAADLSGLGSGACVTSTASALTQTSTQSSTLSPGGAIQADLDLQPAGAFTPTAGGIIGVWLLRSGDGGSTFESLLSTCSASLGPLNRPPDFVIPLATVAVTNTSHIASTVGTIWPGTYKAVAWNNSGTALSANNHVIKMRPYMTVQH